MSEVLLFILVAIIAAVASFCIWRHYQQEPITVSKARCGTYSMPPLIERDSDKSE